jgi:6-phosphogluconolactonase
MQLAFSRVWLVAVAGLVQFSAMGAETAGPQLRVYIGTYTGPKSQGIYTAEFNPSTGKLSAPELAAPSRNPTFLALHPRRPLLYAVEETSNSGGRREGAVSAFAIDEATGKLSLLNQQGSGGAGPCHLCVDKTGNCVLAANYNSGSIASLPILANGGLGATSTVIQHHGSSINRERQSGPHAHFITPAPDNRFALVCDMGLDKVFGYALAPQPTPTELNTTEPPASLSVKPGSGPRHLAFHPNGRVVYLINELASTISVLSYDAARGALAEVQTISTLPKDFNGSDISAEVQVHPSGRFVYGSNRGDDSIAVFGVADERTGRLDFVQRQPALGRTPRHFTFDPTGKWLLVENQDSNNIVVFRLDPATGRLTPAGEQIEVGAPVCLVFLAKSPAQ